MATKGFLCQGGQTNVLVEFQVASVLVSPWKLQITCSKLFLWGALVMWPKHVCFPVEEGIEALCFPVPEPFCQCSEEDFKIPVFLTAVFKSSV